MSSANWDPAELKWQIQLQNGAYLTVRHQISRKRNYFIGNTLNGSFLASKFLIFLNECQILSLQKNVDRAADAHTGLRTRLFRSLE